MIGYVRSQGYSQVSGVGNWALINESVTTGILVWGAGRHEGHLSFRLVDFVVGMRYTYVEMPVDLTFRRGHWASNTDLGLISIYRGLAQGLT